MDFPYYPWERDFEGAQTMRSPWTHHAPCHALHPVPCMEHACRYCLPKAPVLPPTLYSTAYPPPYPPPYSTASPTVVGGLWSELLGRFWAPGLFGAAQDLFELSREVRDFFPFSCHRFLIVGGERTGAVVHQDPKCSGAWTGTLTRVVLAAAAELASCGSRRPRVAHGGFLGSRAEPGERGPRSARPGASPRRHPKALGAPRRRLTLTLTRRNTPDPDPEQVEHVPLRDEALGLLPAVGEPCRAAARGGRGRR